MSNHDVVCPSYQAEEDGREELYILEVCTCGASPLLVVPRSLKESTRDFYSGFIRERVIAVRAGGSEACNAALDAAYLDLASLGLGDSSDKGLLFLFGRVWDIEDAKDLADYEAYLTCELDPTVGPEDSEV